MQPAVYINGKAHKDHGEQWAFDNNVRMVDYEVATSWTDFWRPTGWEKGTCPITQFDPKSFEKGTIRRILKRVPNIPLPIK